MTTHKDLLDRINATDDLNAAIQSTQREISKHKTTIDSNCPTLNVEENEERKEKADKARSDLLEATDRLNGLEQQLANNQLGASIELLLENQAAVDTVKTELDRYQGLIDDQQRIIDTASNHEDLTPPLMAQREQLLTDIALGHDKAPALKKLNAQLQAIKTEQAVTLTSNQTMINDAQQTIDGLKRLVTSSQKKLAHLQTVSLKILDLLLMEQAEQNAIEFNEMAQGLFDKLMQLSAIGILVAKLGNGSETNGLFNWFQVNVPTINSTKPPIDFNNVRFANNALDSVNQIKQNLIKQGVKLDLMGV